MENLQLTKRKTLINSQLQITISTNASLAGLGAYFQDQKTSQGNKDHINVLELGAVNYEMLIFSCLHSKAQPIHIQRDSIVTLSSQKMKFSIKDFFSKCDQIRRKLRIWSHLLKKPLMENFIFCAVPYPFIFGKNRKHSKEIYDCFELGKMVIEQSDHNYCKIFPRITKYRGRYSVQDSKRWRRMEMKSQYIPKDLQIQRKAGDRSFFFANLTPITHFYFIETGPLKPRERERCFRNFLDQ